MADPNNPTAPPALPPGAQTDSTGLVNVVSAGGGLERVRPEDVAQYTATGGRLANADELAESRERSAYGGFGSMVGAGVAGLARGATLGLSDVAIGALGGADTLEKLRRYNPLTSLGGEIAGTLAGGLVGGPTELAGLAGRGAASAVEHVVGEGIASAAAHAAAEGAVFGAGQAVSEAAIGQDYDRLGELLASEVGLGSLIGGGTGLLLGGLGRAARGLTRTADRAIARPGAEALDSVTAGAFGSESPGLGRKLAGWYGRGAEALGSGSGRAGDVEELLTSAAARDRALNPREYLDAAAEKLTRSATELHRATEEAAENFVGTLKRQNVARAIDSVPDRAAAAQSAVDTIARARTVVEEQIESGADKGGILKDLRKELDVLAHSANMGAAAGTPDGLADAYMAADHAKRIVQQRAGALTRKGGEGLRGLRLGQREAREAYIAASEQARGALESDVWGDVGAMQREINRPWSQLLQSERAAGADSFGSRFTTVESAPAGSAPFAPDVRRVSREKVNAWLQGLTHPQDSNSLKALNAYVDNGEQFISAARKHLDMTPETVAKLNAYSAAVRDARASISDAVETATKRARYEAIVGNRGGGLGAAALAGGLGMVGGAPLALAGGAVGLLRDPAHIIRILGGIDQLVGRSSRRMSGALETIGGRAVASTARRVSAGLTERASATIARAAMPVRTYYNAKEQARADFQRREQQRRDLSSNPAAISQLAQAGLQRFSDAAPNTTSQAQQALARQVQYLNAVAPKSAPLAPYRPPPEPSSFEVMLHLWRANAVEDPASLLEGIADGSASPMAAQAVAATAPANYRQMQQDALMTVHDTAAAGKELPERDRINMSMALGLTLDDALEHDTFNAIQAAFATPPPPPAPPRPPTDQQGTKAADKARPPADAHAQEI